MKFNCGREPEEKRARRGQWHTWFAWCPVKLGPHDCRWLEYVQRRGVWINCHGGGWWEWYYREIESRE